MLALCEGWFDGWALSDAQEPRRNFVRNEQGLPVFGRSRFNKSSPSQERQGDQRGECGGAAQNDGVGLGDQVQ